jgi:hypothetical protein
MWSFQNGFFHLATCIEVSPMSEGRFDSLFFLQLINITLSEYASLLLSFSYQRIVGCFQCSAIVDTAGINIHVQVFV